MFLNLFFHQHQQMKKAKNVNGLDCEIEIGKLLMRTFFRYERTGRF